MTRISESAIALAVDRALTSVAPIEGERLDFYLARVRQHASDRLNALACRATTLANLDALAKEGL